MIQTYVEGLLWGEGFTLNNKSIVVTGETDSFGKVFAKYKLFAAANAHVGEKDICFSLLAMAMWNGLV